MSETGYSRSYKRAVLDAAGISSSHQDDPYCVCAYCEDSRAYEEERFQEIMRAVNETASGDADTEEREYQALRATGRNLDAWATPTTEGSET